MESIIKKFWGKDKNVRGHKLSPELNGKIITACEFVFLSDGTIDPSFAFIDYSGVFYKVKALKNGRVDLCTWFPSSLINVKPFIHFDIDEEKDFGKAYFQNLDCIDYSEYRFLILEPSDVEERLSNIYLVSNYFEELKPYLLANFQRDESPQFNYHKNIDLEYWL